MPKIHLPDGRIVHFPDGMDPAEIQRAIDAEGGGAAPTATPESESPSIWQRLKSAAWEASPMAAAEKIMAHPVQYGAVAGGMLAAPLTGGASIPATMAATGLGAAGGAGLGEIADQFRHGPKSAGRVIGDMVLEGGAGALAPVIPPALSKLGGRMVAHAATRAAARPVTGVGDLIDAVRHPIRSTVGRTLTSPGMEARVGRTLQKMGDPMAGEAVIENAGGEPITRIPMSRASIRAEPSTSRTAALEALEQARLEPAPVHAPTEPAFTPTATKLPQAKPKYVPPASEAMTPFEGEFGIGRPASSHVSRPPRNLDADFPFEAPQTPMGHGELPTMADLDRAGDKYRALQALSKEARQPDDAETAKLAARHFGRRLKNLERSALGQPIAPERPLTPQLKQELLDRLRTGSYR